MKPIKITVVSCGEEKSAVTRLIQEKYLKLFGTRPSEAQTYIVGLSEEGIKGTIGFELPSESGSLSIPSGYDFDDADVIPDIRKENVCQSNRWTSEDPDLGVALVYAVCLFAQAKKKEYVWIEQTPGAHRILTRSGMRFHAIPSAKVALDRIDEKDRAYYAEHGPRPCIMIPSQVIATLARRMHRLVEAGKLAFDESTLV